MNLYKKLIGLMASGIILLTLLLLACNVNHSSITTKQIDKKEDKLTLRKMVFWTVKEEIEFTGKDISAVDTAIHHYDTLGREVYYEAKYHKNSLGNYSCDIIEKRYDERDSLVQFICTKSHERDKITSDTVTLERDKHGKLLSEIMIFTRKKSLSTYTNYAYDSLGRITRRVISNKEGLKKQEWEYRYDDKNRQTIVEYTPYKSREHSKLFVHVDTIEVSIDSSEIRKADYDTNIRGNKRMKASQCVNCIKYYKKNKAGRVVEEVRIVRPNDTIYVNHMDYDGLGNRISSKVYTKTDTVQHNWKMEFDSQNSIERLRYYRDGKLKSTTYKLSEYYQ